MTQRSYTAAEYRKAGIDAGPFAITANPNHPYRVARKIPVALAVMHITVGLTDYTPPDASVDTTIRNYGATSSTQASWHVGVDSDSIIPCLPDSYCAWHCGVSGHPGFNDISLGMEIGTGSTNWDLKPDSWTEPTLRNAAVWWAPRVIKHKIPLVVIRDRDLVDRACTDSFNGKTVAPLGFTSHATLAPLNRTDPGMVNGRDTFPWATFFAYVREEMALLNGTTLEDDMYTDADREIDAKRYSDLATRQQTILAALAKNAAEDAARDAALANAVAQIKATGTVDLAAVQAAAQAGATDALAGFTLTLTPPEATP